MPTDFTNTGSSLIIVGGQRFAPGDTKPIKDELVKDVKRCSTCRAGILKEGKASMPETRPRVRPDALPEEMEKALAYVRAEDDITHLQRWASTENAGPNRKEVMEALQRQAMTLSKVPATPPPLS